MAGKIIIALYALAMLCILLYSFAQFDLVIRYLRYRLQRKRNPKSIPDLTEFPMVTVQLPVYNEKYVVERLIEAVAGFDWPKDRFEVQVLDDSDDESVGLIDRKVAEFKALGIQIEHLRRPQRKGFKAGALQYGLEYAKGDFITIFDADFIPSPDFLKTTIKHFTEPEIGVVQTRWAHLNEDYSLLTKMQAFALDAHFTIEQQGRNAAGYFINFNGTAGVWRKSCILDAGGWKADTLTEDLDLSYRAQLRGWKFKFFENLTSPAELPVAMGAIKSQQFRWTKGAAETARINLGKVMRAKVPVKVKIHAGFHLLNSSVFICILSTAILSIPLLWFKHDNPGLERLIGYGSVFLLSMVLMAFFFWVSRNHRYPDPIKRTLNFLVMFPAFLCLSMGFSLHNALAAIDGLIGRKTPFVRTPKFNIKSIKDNWKNNTYSKGKIDLLTVMEGLLTLYFLGGIVLSFYLHDFAMLPFLLMLLIGYGSVFYFSVAHARA